VRNSFLAGFRGAEGNPQLTGDGESVAVDTAPMTDTRK
jgi:hypothetical protein